MRRKMRKISPLTLLLFFFLKMPSPVWAQLDEAIVYERIMQRKNMAGYREGTRYTNDTKYVNTVEFNGYSAGCFIGSGCFGYMLDMMEYASEYKYPIRVIEASYNNIPEIHIGDGIRLNNDTHSVVVIGKSETDIGVITVTEANWNRSIHWGREIDLASYRTGLTWVATFWPDSFTGVSDSFACAEHCDIVISNSSGIVIKQIKQANLPFQQYLRGLPRGMYIVNVDKRTYKIAL